MLLHYSYRAKFELISNRLKKVQRTFLASVFEHMHDVQARWPQENCSGPFSNRSSFVRIFGCEVFVATLLDIAIAINYNL